MANPHFLNFISSNMPWNWGSAEEAREEAGVVVGAEARGEGVEAERVLLDSKMFL